MKSSPLGAYYSRPFNPTSVYKVVGLCEEGWILQGEFRLRVSPAELADPNQWTLERHAHPV